MNIIIDLSNIMYNDLWMWNKTKLENTLNILHHEKKGPLMNTLKQFHIHRLKKDNLQLNDTYTDTYNPIFDLITTQYK
jgi:hypothetical protein